MPPPSDAHDDVVPNRVFEISSVGAVAICPDIPGVREWFGDSVLYYAADLPPGEIAREIIRQYRFFRANPAIARDMGERARAIFEESFAAERLLANLVAYHHDKQRDGARRAAHLKSTGQPRISVVIRCGGRPTQMLRTAVDSVRSQSFGRFTVIFSKYKDIDLREIIADCSGAIEQFKEVFIPNGGRAATMSAGLAAVETEYFAVLDDDNSWMSDHFEWLFHAAWQTDPDFDAVFSGVICNSEQAALIDGGLRWRRNIYLFGFRGEIHNIYDITQDIGTNSFVAKSELLKSGFTAFPDMDTAEELAACCRHHQTQAPGLQLQGDGLSAAWLRRAK